MQNDADTSIVIKELNGTTFFGKPLTVQISRSKEGGPPSFPPRGDRDRRDFSPPPRRGPRRFFTLF